MLAQKVGTCLKKYVPNYVVFDLETTGLSSGYDDIIEISAIRVRNGEIEREFSTLVNPGKSIPYQVSQVNHITDEMVVDAPNIETALSEFLSFIGDDILVGHNIHSFDMKFICRDSERLFGETVGNDYVDTLYLARAYLPELKRHSLSELSHHYGISTIGAHRALNDCRMNQQVYEFLREEIDHPKKELPKCPRCGGLLQKRNGRFGEFWGCISYPSCRFTKNI